MVMKFTRTFGYFCGLHFKIITGIMTDTIIPGYIRYPGISHNFWNI